MTPAVPTRLALTALLAAGLVASGCSKKDDAVSPPPAPAGKAASTAKPAPTDREIRITEVKPDADALKVGESAHLTISGTYVLPPQGGSLGVVVQDAKNALVTNKLSPLAGGSGTFTEQVDFKVPATDKVVLNLPLYLKDETVSVTVATKEFKVTAK